MGTLCVRITIRSHGRYACGWGLATSFQSFLDCGLHGAGACSGDGLQPLGGCGSRRQKSSHQDARIPAGLLSRRFVGSFTLVTSLSFLVAASQLNRLTLLLAPAELAVVLLYSYSKRFTRWSHLVLGLALGIAPAAAWIAVRGSLDARILVLTFIVLCWVGGFDMLYACQDAEHDRLFGLKSIPASIGIPNAFLLARCLHIIMLASLVWLIHLFGLGILSWAGITAVAVLLLREHLIISPGDLSRMNAAFFTMNGLISVVFFVFVGADILLRR